MSAQDSSRPPSSANGAAGPATLREPAAVCFSAEPAADDIQFVAQAPGRLDVLGGMSDFTGAPVLSVTTAETISVAVQLRNDDQVVVYDRTAFARPESGAWRRRLAQFDDGGVHAGVSSDGRLGVDESAWSKPIAGVISAMFRSKKLDGSQSGVTVVIGGNLPPLVDLGCATALGSAATLALSEAWGLNTDAVECARLVNDGESIVIGFASGPGAALAILHGQTDELVQIDGRDRSVMGRFPIPSGAKILGIDSGDRHADLAAKIAIQRATSAMGITIIERVMSAQSGHSPIAAIWLSDISLEDYVARFRNRLPLKMKGSMFIDRLGQPGDASVHVEPDHVYKIRSRTEHHIYDAHRCMEFAKLMKRASQDVARLVLKAAGQEMLASHWSYGQRCGLVGIDTDRLVKGLKGLIPSGEVYGVRASGHGGGGVIVVLMNDSPAAMAAVENVVRDYEKETARITRFFKGHSKGALAYQVVRSPVESAQR